LECRYSDTITVNSSYCKTLGLVTDTFLSINTYISYLVLHNNPKYAVTPTPVVYLAIPASLIISSSTI